MKDKYYVIVTELGIVMDYDTIITEYETMEEAIENADGCYVGEDSKLIVVKGEVVYER